MTVPGVDFSTSKAGIWEFGVGEIQVVPLAWTGFLPTQSKPSVAKESPKPPSLFLRFRVTSRGFLQLKTEVVGVFETAKLDKACGQQSHGSELEVQCKTFTVAAGWPGNHLIGDDGHGLEVRVVRIKTGLGQSQRQVRVCRCQIGISERLIRLSTFKYPLWLQAILCKSFGQFRAMQQ